MAGVSETVRWHCWQEWDYLTTSYFTFQLCRLDKPFAHYSTYLRPLSSIPQWWTFLLITGAPSAEFGQLLTMSTAEAPIFSGRNLLDAHNSTSLLAPATGLGAPRPLLWHPSGRNNQLCHKHYLNPFTMDILYRCDYLRLYRRILHQQASKHIWKITLDLEKEDKVTF